MNTVRTAADELIAKAAASLEEKRKAKIAEMGTKWILHPDNYVKMKRMSESKRRNIRAVK
jgi:hypothetical protein